MDAVINNMDDPMAQADYLRLPRRRNRYREHPRGIPSETTQAILATMREFPSLLIDPLNEHGLRIQREVEQSVRDIIMNPQRIHRQQPPQLEEEEGREEAILDPGRNHQQQPQQDNGEGEMNMEEDEEGNEELPVEIPTILDSDWQITEAPIAKLIRLFPGALQYEQGYETYTIHLLEKRRWDDYRYGLDRISMIPCVAQLGRELLTHDKQNRGGLLTIDNDTNPQHHGWNLLQRLVCYCYAPDGDTSRQHQVDACFMAVLHRLKDTDLFYTNDIQEHNLVGLLCIATAGGCFLEDRFQFLIARDKTPLAMSCYPSVQDETWKPIHWAAFGKNTNIHRFRSVLMAGLQYSPPSLGYCFTEGIRKYKLPRPEEESPDYDAKESNRISNSKGTPYELACVKFGRDVTTEIFLECVAAAAEPHDGATIAAIPNGITGPLLLSAVTNLSIHLDGLYLLLRCCDPSEALATIKHHLQPKHTISSTAVFEADEYDTFSSDLTKTSKRPFETMSRP